MAQRLFRSDDDSKLTSKYGNGSQGSKTFSSNETLDSGDYYYNGTLTGTSGEVTGNTDLADGTYNLPCKIIQTKGAGSNASVNYEYNKLLSVASGIAQFAFPLTKNWVSGAQFVTSGNWVNVTINTGITVTITAYSSSTGKGGVFYITGKGTFLQVGTGVVDLRDCGFEKGVKHQSTSERDYGGYGGYGAAGRSGKGGFSGNGGNVTVAGDFPSGGSRDRDGYESSHGAAGGENYTGGGGGGGANSAQQDESSGGGGGGGNYYGGGGGGNGTDSNGAGGVGGAASGLGGGDGGGWPSAGVNLAGDASGASSTANNYSGHGGDGYTGAARNGGGGGGGADANPQAELKAMHMGGGGGGGAHYNNNGSTESGSDGGTGGGLSTITFPRITLTGGVLTTGSIGQSAQSNRGGGGGGGAGGDQRYIGQYIILGSSCNADGGAGSAPAYAGDGGNGSRGTIHCDYLVSVTGTTSPTTTTRQDKSLRILRAGAGVLAGLMST